MKAQIIIKTLIIALSLSNFAFSTKTSCKLSGKVLKKLKLNDKPLNNLCDDNLIEIVKYLDCKDRNNWALASRNHYRALITCEKSHPLIITIKRKSRENVEYSIKIKKLIKLVGAKAKLLLKTKENDNLKYKNAIQHVSRNLAFIVFEEDLFKAKFTKAEKNKLSESNYVNLVRYINEDVPNKFKYILSISPSENIANAHSLEIPSKVNKVIGLEHCKKLKCLIITELSQITSLNFIKKIPNFNKESCKLKTVIINTSFRLEDEKVKEINLFIKNFLYISFNLITTSESKNLFSTPHKNLKTTL